MAHTVAYTHTHTHYKHKRNEAQGEPFEPQSTHPKAQRHIVLDGHVELQDACGVRREVALSWRQGFESI